MSLVDGKEVSEKEEIENNRSRDVVRGSRLIYEEGIASHIENKETVINSIKITSEVWYSDTKK